MPRRVLIIVYYWPPSGGGGVQRWVKFVKYLPQHGWAPEVYAPDGANYADYDSTLQNEVPPDVPVMRHPIWEPHRLFMRWTKSSTHQRGDKVLRTDRHALGSRERFSVWLRANVFLPDPRVGWVVPSVRYLTRHLSQQPVDLIVTSGPPHSVHLIGLLLQRRLNIPWVADFRDPWTTIEYHSAMPMTRIASTVHQRLERRVLTEADRIVTVSPTWGEELEQLGASSVEVITNGYDATDFAARPASPSSEQLFLLSHVGTLPLARNPTTLWEALEQLCKTVPDFSNHLRIELVGRTDPAVVQSVKKRGLAGHLTLHDYLPHAEAVRRMSAARVLLLPLSTDRRNSPGRIPGKLFEYLAARRPILYLGPLGNDGARIIRDAEAGACVYPADIDTLIRLLRDWYARWCSAAFPFPQSAPQRYSRARLTAQLASVLDAVVNGRVQ